MPDSIYLLIAIAALAVFGAVWIYAGWEKWDDRRRSDRLVHRNLQRMMGR
jgi:uncharacterized membrane protein YphA (DoxX/SURF4 family)